MHAEIKVCSIALHCSNGTLLSLFSFVSTPHPRTVFLLFSCPDETKLERIVGEKRVHEFINKTEPFDDMRETREIKIYSEE